MILNVRGVYRYTENEIEKYFVYIGDSDYSKIIVAGEIGEKMMKDYILNLITLIWFYI